MKAIFNLSILAAALALTACGQKEVSWNELESQRNIAAENAKFNAVSYRAQYFPAAQIVSRGDSTQAASCPQGDGWASIDLVVNGGIVAKLKCSTVSSNIACMTDADFKARPQYAGQDGKCSSQLPYPLPKLAG
jgi:hypothetical protein